MGAGVRLVVPLLLSAVVLTLICSTYLLGQTGWKKATRFAIVDGGALDRAPLTQYMGSAGAMPQPTKHAKAPPLLEHEAAHAWGPRLRSYAESDYDGFFLVAQDEPLPPGDPNYLRQLLRSLLGMATLLKRTLVLPAALCACRDANLTQCDGPPVPPFDCPLRETLSASSWASPPVAVRPARFLLGPAEIPSVARCSHLRVLLPDGMDDSELGHALRSYASTRWLEISSAQKTFCGWDTRMPGNRQRMQDFARAADRVLGGAGGRLHVCTHYRGGTGEVLQFTNLGCNSKTVVTAARERLPENLRNLPRDTDIMVTFATGSVATMACNWVATVRTAGVREVLIGALDAEMMAACEREAVPCILIEGGEVTRALASRSAANVRSDPAIYPKMSVLKVGFYRELLSFGYNVWACDADAVFANDPRAMMREEPWVRADVAVATDCIDVPSDRRYPLLHCDFNTGLVYMRSNPDVIEFTERWRETIANAKESRIRDQAAFNMMTKLHRPEALHSADGQAIPRLFRATNGGDGHIKLAVLPLERYLNGHTFFVQHVHTLPAAPLPISVHMTYQFAEGSKFAHGKRQRLRQAGLWLVDPDSYYNGRYVTATAATATLQYQEMGPEVDSRDAVRST
jgi:hypothetical protein